MDGGPDRRPGWALQRLVFAANGGQKTPGPLEPLAGKCTGLQLLQRMRQLCEITDRQQRAGRSATDPDISQKTLID